MKLLMTLKTVADHFNTFFTNMASNLVNKLPSAITFSLLVQNFLEFFTVQEIPKIKLSILKKSMKILFLKN